MSEQIKEFGVVGLGRMGGNLALQAIEKGFRVVGYDVNGIADEYKSGGVVVAEDLDDLLKLLSPQRAVFIYVPAGRIVDKVIDSLSNTLQRNDIIVDGGNSYWGDSIRRHEKLTKLGLNFVDLGTSGGVSGARHGACFMAGGEDLPVSRIQPVLETLSVKGGYVHAGPPGAGHFTKLVHNGIEFGMLQAIGEGVALLEAYKDPLKIADVLHCWRNGSVIRSWLVDLMEQAYRSNGGLDKIPSYVDDTGEVNWLVGDAMNMEVSTPVIAQAVMQLIASRDDRKNWAKAIAMMRHGFGGHPFGPNKGVSKERHEGRVGDLYRKLYKS